MRRIAVQSVILILFFALLLFADRTATGIRTLPGRTSSGPVVIRVNTQRELYDAYKKENLRGVRVIHLNRFLNMMAYYPPGETQSVPFPVPVHDIRPDYEAGLDSHNSLFIANRTGLVRSVTVVLPDQVFDERQAAFLNNPEFRLRDRRLVGYAEDLPILVTRLADLPAISEPVIVNVDAGYFMPGVDPAGAAAILRERCPDIRVAVLVMSRDENDVTDAMRKALRDFEAALAGNHRAQGGREKRKKNE